MALNCQKKNQVLKASPEIMDYTENRKNVNSAKAFFSTFPDSATGKCC